MIRYDNIRNTNAHSSVQFSSVQFAEGTQSAVQFADILYKFRAENLFNIFFNSFKNANNKSLCEGFLFNKIFTGGIHL